MTGEPRSAAGTEVAAGPASPFPRFSPSELQRRRAAIDALAESGGAGHVLVYGRERVGNAVQWLSEWPTTTEAALLLTPGEQDVLMVQHYNHLPNARRLALGVDVRWGGPSTLESVIDLLRQRQAEALAVIGPLGHTAYRRLEAEFGTVTGLDEGYRRLRMVKSPEEIARLAHAAALSDLAIQALADQVEPGMTERHLAAIVEFAYLAEGGTNHIHYFGVTSMADPDRCVPAQFQSTRVMRPGDVIFCEISAAYWGYAGQVLRTFTLGADPTPLYSRMHEVAEEAFEAIVACIRPGVHVGELVEASAAIEKAGFTIFDDLVHGYGGGYLPPVLGSSSRPNLPVPDLRLEEGMALVVQPNVITPDQRAGVQTGELLVVTPGGAESLHSAPRGLRRIG